MNMNINIWTGIQEYKYEYSSHTAWHDMIHDMTGDTGVGVRHHDHLGPGLPPQAGWDQEVITVWLMKDWAGYLRIWLDTGGSGWILEDLAGYW